MNGRQDYSFSLDSTDQPDSVGQQRGGGWVWGVGAGGELEPDMQ